MKTTPLALFDSIENFKAAIDYSYLSDGYNLDDIKITVKFLKSYIGGQGTFNSYRREIERLLHWCALIANKALKTLKREDIEAFIVFCQKPPKTWMGKTKPARFIVENGARISNPAWRPFIVNISKAARRKGFEIDKNKFALSHPSQRVPLHFYDNTLKNNEIFPL